MRKRDKPDNQGGHNGDSRNGGTGKYSKMLVRQSWETQPSAAEAACGYRRELLWLGLVAAMQDVVKIGIPFSESYLK